MLTPTTACLGIAVAAAGITLVMLRARRRQERRTAMVDADPGPTTDEPLRRLRKCEAILARRVSACRLVLILEAAVDIHNVTTVLRTAECLGLQEVWIIHPRVGSKRKGQDLGAASLDGSRGNATAQTSCFARLAKRSFLQPRSATRNGSGETVRSAAESVYATIEVPLRSRQMLTSRHGRRRRRAGRRKHVPRGTCVSRVA